MIVQFESYDDALNHYKKEYPQVNPFFLELALSLDYQEQMDKQKKLCEEVTLFSNNHDGSNIKERLKKKLKNRIQ